jgi:hypothetical protein
VRRYEGSTLGPKYLDSDVIQVLNLAASIGLFAALELAALSDDRELELSILALAQEHSRRSTPGGGYRKPAVRDLDES